MTHRLGGYRKNAGARKEAEAARLAFLRAHPRFWDLPSDRMDMTDERRETLYSVLQEMLEAGLYSHNSAKGDLQWGLRELVGRIRKETV